MNNSMNHLIQKIHGYRVNRKYKDRLFRYIFKDKKDLLELYNAINETSYTDTSGLTITTLSDAIYLGMKNDIAFLIGNCLNLYEHQSTWNPNMPLRGLIYLTDMIRAYVEINHYSLYSSKQISLPFPKYIVFYNGETDATDCEELCLSASFPKTQKGLPALECRATLININYGHNQELLNKSKRLSDYAYFIHQVRFHLNRGYSQPEAIDLAVDECIESGILQDILTTHRAEVKNMLLTTFNEKEYKKLIKKEAREEGLEEGREEGHKKGLEEGREEGREEGLQKCQILYRHLLADGRNEDIAKSTTDEIYLKQLLKEYGL